MLIGSAVNAAKGNLSDKKAVQAALEKADFKSVRGDFKFDKNHYPIQNFYMQEVVKSGDAYTLKTTATAVENGKNIHGAQCKM
jgi:branched-chain amino acid transport system substrate-binding protein